MTNSSLVNMAIETVSFPSENGDFPCLISPFFGGNKNKENGGSMEENQLCTHGGRVSLREMTV